ncbi:MAG TPA: hypothetical protein VEA59_02835 [Patescibacteria group bacterium]|nr:hypothetical protein [Patescibacteria group bacterium]
MPPLPILLLILAVVAIAGLMVYTSYYFVGNMHIGSTFWVPRSAISLEDGFHVPGSRWEQEEYWEIDENVIVSPFYFPLNKIIPPILKLLSKKWYRRYGRRFDKFSYNVKVKYVDYNVRRKMVLVVQEVKTDSRYETI